MEKILDQYLAAVPTRAFQWTDVVNPLTEDIQQRVLKEVVRSPLSVCHPPSHSYRVTFIKHIITKVEADGCDVAGDVYELYAELLSTPSSQLPDHCWKTYHLLSGDYVSLMESPNLISDGTTGLTTWQAAFKFVEWLSSPDSTAVLHSKSVLELGSGLGFTGLAVCKQYEPKSYIFTDCHSKVLERLRANMEHNLTGSKVDTEVCKLDWSSQDDIEELLRLHTGTLDYILATEFSLLACSVVHLRAVLSLTVSTMSWTLHIKELQGGTVTVTVAKPSTATILDVKRAYHQKEHTIPPYEQRLVFERKELEDDHRLSSYPEVENGATIFLIRLIPFQLFVKGMDGSSHTINIPSKTPERFSVSHLKLIVQEKTGVRPEEQRLQYAGKQLTDTMTLGDYNLTNNATLHLVSRLRGGLAYYSRESIAIMSCGHTIGSSALYSRCMSAVRNKRSQVTCPNCYSEWTLRSLKQASFLTSSQLNEIEEGLTRNFCLSMPGVTSCEVCGGVWSDSGARGRVCPSCSAQKRNDNQATLQVLASCDTKQIGHATWCPVIRACPNCGKLIQHTDGCKRVDCDGCKTTFCFVCLTIRPPSMREYYPCIPECPTASRQTVLPRVY